MGSRFDFLERLNLPDESLPGQVLVEIMGENRVLIERHQGVREFSRNQIGINVKFGVIQVTGCNLELRYMTNEQLIITGNISCVTLMRRGGA